MTDADPRFADSTRPDADRNRRVVDRNRRVADRANRSADRDADRAGDAGDDRPRMRDVSQTTPDDLDANGVWSRGPAAPTGADERDAAPADD